MPKLIFTNASALTPNQDGTAVVFTYQLDGSEDSHTIHMAGRDQPSDVDEEAQNGYTQLLFAGALFVIETNWDRQKQLPDETKQYQQNSDFPIDKLTRIPWQGYELVLPA